MLRTLVLFALLVLACGCNSRPSLAEIEAMAFQSVPDESIPCTMDAAARVPENDYWVNQCGSN